MRFTKLGALAVVATSLIAMDAHAARMDRKFHPVVNDDPQNAHLNVQTPGADINQTVTFRQEPGPDGQVIPAGETQVAASCAAKDANGDIDLSGGSACASSTASAPIAAHATVTASTNVHSLSPSMRVMWQTIPVPSAAPASAAPAGNAKASSAAPSNATRSVEAAPAAAPLPAQHTETVRVAALPAKQPAPTVTAPAVRPDVAPYGLTATQWLEMGAAAALLFAIGLGLLFRLGAAELLRMRRDDERGADEEHATGDGHIAVSAAIAQNPLPTPRGPW